jgi:AraC-like DNA-binding protein
MNQDEIISVPVSADEQQEANVKASSGRIETCDIAQLEEVAKPWDVRLHQIAPGRFQGEMQYVSTPEMMIYEEHCNQPIDASGTSPEGFFMVGTSVASRRPPVDWCGRTIDLQRWACSPSGGEVGFATPANTHQIVLLVRSELLSSALGPEAADELAKRNHLDLSTSQGAQFSGLITGMVRQYSANPKLLTSFETRSLQSTLLETLNCGIGSSVPVADGESMPVRRAAVRRAIEYLDQLMKPITAIELASEVGVCQRTLEYGFCEVLGIPPAKYLRFHRLNRACRELASADPRWVTVTQVAARWGFLHPGRFSGAYLTHFGEHPSTTLKRVRPIPSARLADVFPREM